MDFQKKINEYCVKYNIPLEHLSEILEDQKVLPMIRGKATEYNAFKLLTSSLDSSRWIVQKLNLNAQANQPDEDISITNKRSGDRLKVETKNAVRGSFQLGTQRHKIKEPHFRVKIHKSRSNISRVDTTNDRYLLGEFDLVVCNLSNALFARATLEDNLVLIEDDESVKYLKKQFNVTSNEELIQNSYDKWYCCFPHTIVSEDGSIPRSPAVLLDNDPNWFDADELENVLLDELKRIRKAR